MPHKTNQATTHQQPQEPHYILVGFAEQGVPIPIKGQLAMRNAALLLAASALALGYFLGAASRACLPTGTVSHKHKPTKVANEVDLAVCVVGAARSFAEPKVIKSFQSMRFPERTQFFHYLFVATELSMRGQVALGRENATDMAHALSNSTAFQFQYQANDFTCDQMTTGKFYKLSACMKLIDSYSMNHTTVFKSIAFVRPDLLWSCPEFPSYHTILAPNMTIGWYMKSHDEVFAISGNKGSREVALNVSQAYCCDSKSRQPAGCFRKRLKEPRANYIQQRHFETNLRSIPNSFICDNKGCTVRIQRTSYGKAIIKNSTRGISSLHGKFRPAVTRCDIPQTSPVVSSFQSLPFECGKQMLEDLLSVPILPTCSNRTARPQSQNRTT